MQTRYIRLVTRSSSYADHPMYFDAPVQTTEEGSIILTKSALLGFMGDLRGELYPFVLRKKNSQTQLRLAYDMDFGTGYEELDRYFTTNLPTKRIAKGEQFTISMYIEERGIEEHIFKIHEMIDLLRHQPIDSL